MKKFRFFFVLLIIFLSIMLGCQKNISGQGFFKEAIQHPDDLSSQESGFLVEPGATGKTDEESINIATIPVHDLQKKRDYVKGVILVKFREGADVITRADASDLVSEITSSNDNLAEVLDVNKVFSAEINQKNYEIKKKYGLQRWVEIKVDESTDAAEEIKNWNALDDVELAEIEYLPILLGSLDNPGGLDQFFHPNDLLYPDQWHHHDDYMQSERGWYLERGSKDVIIAVMDSQGVEWYHEDLVENTWQNPGEDYDGDGHVLEYIGNEWVFDPGDVNGIDDDQNGYIDDFIGWDFQHNNPVALPGENHGSACAGSAAARGNNTLGVAGTCMECSIMILKITSTAVEYAADNNASVLSMSFKTGNSQIFHDALRYAYEMGVVLVAAAGNDGDDAITYPAGYDEVLAVTNIQQGDLLYDGSSATNYGSWTDVGAPGKQIYTTYTQNEYDLFTGTSAAAPVAAGLAGLIKSHHPEFSSQQIMSVLHSAVDPINSNDKFAGTGRINVYKSLQYENIPIALFAKAFGKGYYYDIENNEVHIRGTASGDNFDHYTVEYGINPYPSSWTLIEESENQIVNDILMRLDLNTLPEDNMYTFKLTTYDTLGNTAIDMTSMFLEKNPVYTKFQIDHVASSSPAFADADNDGQLELFLGTKDQVNAWNLDGSYLPGWPKNISGFVDSSPAIANLDEDEELEIVIGSPEGKVYIWNHDGSSFSNWPQTTIESIDEASPVIGDVNADNNPDIIISAGSYVYIWNKDGSLHPGWPKELSGYARYSPILANIDSDKELEIIMGYNRGQVYIWNHDGSNVPGWPIQMSAANINAPVVGDVDNDGELEILIARQYDTHLYDLNGSLVPGWPFGYGAIMGSQPVIGNLDQDEELEIVIGTRYSRRVYLLNHDGSILPGWPKYMGYEIPKTPALVDLDEDGQLEIILANSLGAIYVWNADGNEIIGWSSELNGAVKSSFTAGYESDNFLDIAVTTQGFNTADGYLHIWHIPVDNTDIGSEWSMFHHDMRHSGLYSYHCDDVIEGECSPNQPLFCTQGGLINNCMDCGCPPNKQCDPDGGCSKEKEILPASQST